MPTTLARRSAKLPARFNTGNRLSLLVFPQFRSEQLTDDGHYVVRAEIPGVNPEKDIDVSVTNGVVNIRAEHIQEKRADGGSESLYTTLVQTVPLPVAARAETATATYTHGILEVSFTMVGPRVPGRHIAIDGHHRVEDRQDDGSHGRHGVAERTAGHGR